MNSTDSWYPWFVNWLGDLTIEMTSMEAEKYRHLDQLIPGGTRVYVVHLPDKGYEQNFEFMRMLIDQGMVPVPHIAARNLADKEELKSILSGIQKLNLDEVLLLGGGIDYQIGNFKTTMDMLETSYFEEHGIKKFGIALHPEKHPYASDKQILEGYHQKYNYLRSRQLEIYGVTQFCFSVEDMLNLEKFLKDQDLMIPFRAGVVGKSSFFKLIKYSIMCGVGNSINVLKKEALNISKVALGYDPFNFIEPLIEAKIQMEETIKIGTKENDSKSNLLVGLHLFPFGNLEKTLDYFKNFNNKN